MADITGRTIADATSTVQSLSDMMQSHAEWKLRLRTAIRQRDTLDVASIRRDDVCMMGKWLGGETARALGEQLAQLRRAHASFHLAAAAVAERSNAGAYGEAEEMLGAGSEFMRATAEVRTAIMAAERLMQRV